MKAGRELDTKMAEFMGWESQYIEYGGTGGEYVWIMPNGKWQSEPDVPEFSTDISAVLPVLEKVRKNFFSTTITIWDHTDKVVIVGDKRQGHNENISVLTVQAETLPLAICKFALRTKENENE